MATKAVASSSSSSAAASMRTARACDVCANRSACWYCAADEAYLCTACDTHVHSANAVSLRHERVRLAPNCIPKKVLAASSQHLVPEDALLADPASSPRKRAGRPYAHHLRKLTRLSNQLASTSTRDVKEEESNHHHHSLAELELFDFLDADEFLNDGNQEVPSLSTGVDKSSPCCSSDLEFMSSDDQSEGDVEHSADSLAACFKGKAAHSQTVIVPDTDQSLVPDAVTAPADTNVDLAVEDGFLFPGDIPGLDVGFDSFVPEMDLVDDFSQSFDLAFQDGMDAFERDSNASVANSESTGAAAETKPTETSPHNFLAGPFAKFFAQKKSTSDSQLDLPMDPEGIKREAKAMLQCCREGEDEAQKLVPSLQLNITDVMATWSHREEPWILGPVHGSDDSTSSGSDDAALVPDMDGDRDARVLRYKEKRRTRLFSKTIRYEVRKLNAERRPRMKGRFVKRSTTTTTSS